jgi:dTDP-4-dehydrorhamnose reductase
VVDDQRGCPTYTVDLARAIAGLVSQQASGIVHATNNGNCSWFEFAKAILDLEQQLVAVTPVTSTEFPRPARRPTNSVLSPSSLHAHGIYLPPWRDALTEYLRQRQS